MMNKGKSGRAIVQPITDAYFTVNRKMNMVDETALIKALNRARAKCRPRHPADLNFKLQENGIPENLNVHYVEIGKGETKRRHLICFIDKQAKLLTIRKRWYMDGTFKIVKQPFVQLWTIHGFIRSGLQKKMVPLMYVLMSRRSRKDYKLVLNYITDRILSNKQHVTQCVLDFEKAVWLALGDVFGDGVKIFGCGFHWTQCLFRRLKKLGLTAAYRNKKITRVRTICK